MEEQAHNISNDDVPEKYQEIVKLVGLDAFLALSKEYGGGFVYFPKIDSLTILDRNRAIISEFDGRNYAYLARKYNLSPRWVREIISCGRAAAGNKIQSKCRQLSLF